MLRSSALVYDNLIISLRPVESNGNKKKGEKGGESMDRGTKSIKRGRPFSASQPNWFPCKVPHLPLAGRYLPTNQLSDTVYRESRTVPCRSTLQTIT